MKRLALLLALVIISAACYGRQASAGEYSPYVDRAAQTLGLSRATLYRRIKRMRSA